MAGNADAARVGPGNGRVFVLHDAQATGADSIVKEASFSAKTGVVTVPARTVAVFTQAAGSGLNLVPSPGGTWMRARLTAGAGS